MADNKVVKFNTEVSTPQENTSKSSDSDEKSEDKYNTITNNDISPTENHNKSYKEEDGDSD